MYFGENPDKVKNIVSASLGKFQDMYAPALKVKLPSRVLASVVQFVAVVPLIIINAPLNTF